MNWIIYRRGLINAFWAFLVIGFAMATMLAPGFLMYGRLDLLTTLIVAAIFVVGSILSAAGFWIFGMLTRGTLLLDLGRIPMWYVFLIQAFVLPIPFATFYLPRQNEDFWSSLGKLCIGLAFSGLVSAFFLMMALGRLQIRENGLWVYSALVPWRNLTSYEWKGNTLLFRSSLLGFWPMQGALLAPEDKVSRVQKILAKRAGRSPFLEEDGIEDERPASVDAAQSQSDSTAFQPDEIV